MDTTNRASLEEDEEEDLEPTEDEISSPASDISEGEVGLVGKLDRELLI